MAEFIGTGSTRINLDLVRVIQELADGSIQIVWVNGDAVTLKADDALVAALRLVVGGL
jgi:hypothetical protein